MIFKYYRSKIENKYKNLNSLAYSHELLTPLNAILYLSENCCEDLEMRGEDRG